MTNHSIKTGMAIINRAHFIGALMDEDKVVYLLFMLKWHVFRYENGRITKADAEDIETAKRYLNS